MRLLSWVGMSCFAVLLGSCPGRQKVECSENMHCDLGPGGTCVVAATGNEWCAYPDPACPSGYRFSDLDVGDGVGNTCVPDGSVANDGSIDGPIVPGSWGKQIPGPGFESVGAVAIAPDGSVFITGYFTMTIDIGGGPLTAAGTQDMFVAKYTADGMHVWSKRFGNGSSQAGGFELKVLSNGDLALGGNYRGSLTLGTATLNAVGNQDLFVARLDGNGNPLWARSGGTSNYDELYDMSIDASDNIAACGAFTGTGAFLGSPNLTGSTDAFLVRLTGAGDHSWSRAMAADGINDDCGVTSMANGDVVFVGNFNGTVNAGGSTFTSTSGSLDMYIVRYAAANGAHVWSAPKGGTGNDFALDVEASGTSIVVAGGFSGTVNFGGTDLTAAAGDDAFVAKFDASNGNHQFSIRVGGGSQESAQHLSVRSDGQITATGLFAGTVNFGGSSLTSNGDFDPFVIDLDGSNGAVLAVKSVGGSSRDEAHDVASSIESLVFAGSFASSIVVLGQTYTSMGMLDGYVIRFKR